MNSYGLDHVTLAETVAGLSDVPRDNVIMKLRHIITSRLTIYHKMT